MVRKKKVGKKTRSKNASRPKSKKISLRGRIDSAQRNFVLFLMLFVVSFVLYAVSTSPLLINFFGIISVILGFVAFAFLISIIILFILDSGKGKR